MKSLFFAIVVFASFAQTAMSDTFDLPQIEKEECKNMQNPVKVNNYMIKHKETFQSFDSTPTQKVTATSIFSNFSGNANPMFNHPAIYAHGKKEPKITVIGCGTHKEFPLSQLEKAFEEYKLLLELNGYKEQ